MSKKQTSFSKNEIWEFGGDITEAFESTDLCVKAETARNN